MRKILGLLFTILILNFTLAANASAQLVVAGASAGLKISEPTYDYRVNVLRAYLAKNGSPLADYAENFVATADKYNLDWRLVPAISGVESTFGKRIPYNSYNAYGWANGDYKFASWEDSIEIVTKTLREKYLDKGAGSISQIARRYAPPSSSWAGKVRYFMRKIDSLPLAYTI